MEGGEVEHRIICQVALRREPPGQLGARLIAYLFSPLSQQSIFSPKNARSASSRPVRAVQMLKAMDCFEKAYYPGRPHSGPYIGKIPRQGICDVFRGFL